MEHSGSREFSLILFHQNRTETKDAQSFPLSKPGNKIKVSSKNLNLNDVPTKIQITNKCETYYLIDKPVNLRLHLGLLQSQLTEILCCPDASVDTIVGELLHQLVTA